MFRQVNATERIEFRTEGDFDGSYYSRHTHVSSFPIFERELKERDIPYKIHYLEEHPELIQKFGLKRSPNFIVDGKLIFNMMPEMAELRKYLDDLKERSTG